MTATIRLDRPARSLAVAATICTAIASLVVIHAARWGPDWPAQEFRAWIAVHDGLSAWTARWYGGSALPGYSILYPPMAKVVGVGGVGLAAVVLASWAAAGLAPHAHWRAVVYSGGVAVNLVETLLIGQVPFLLGTAFGVTAFRALARGRHWTLVAVLAALSSLATPLAGAFLVVLIPACAVSVGTRRAVALGGGLVGALAALAVGGAAGPFPMPWLLFVSVIAFAVLVAALSPRSHHGLHLFAACYLVVAVVLFVVPNPIGGNVARLGKMLALPLACHYLVVDKAVLRVRAAAIIALAILWPTVPFIGSVAHGANDPSQSQQFYSGMMTYLEGHESVADRVEVPFTREHWEAFWVAKRLLLARGWERQTDYRYNEVLYGPLTAGTYRRWLSENAVGFVALPDVPIDSGGSAEVRLLANAPAYLEPVWHDADWQIWRVRGATPLVTGAAALGHLGTSSVRVDFRHAGWAEVRVRYDPLWQVSAGRACLTATPDGWIDLHAEQPGPVELNASVNGDLLTPAAASC